MVLQRISAPQQLEPITIGTLKYTEGLLLLPRITHSVNADRPEDRSGEQRPTHTLVRT